MEWVTTSGKMEESTLGTGIITICMVWVSTSIQIMLPTKVNLKRIRRQVMGYTFGMMEGSMKVGGTMENSMVLEYTKIQAKAR